MSEHFNRLTPAEAERLALLAEECGEVVQVIGKILRHGYGSHHPNDRNGPDNRALLEREVGDLCYCIDTMMAVGDLDGLNVALAQTQKNVKVARYLHHQE